MEHIVLLCLAVMAFLIGWSSRRKEKPRTDHHHPSSEKHPLVLRPYEFLRQNALSLTSDDMSLTSAAGEDPYSIVMDMALPDGTTTLVCVADGNASLYLSTGVGTIGGYVYESIRNAAINFVKSGGNYISDMAPARSYPLPRAGEVSFYVLTKQGTYTARDTLDSIAAGNSKWSALFIEANNVINAIRLERESAREKRGNDSEFPASI
jgi:hypothetical protein